MTQLGSAGASNPDASAESIGDPIAFIRKEHDRQFEICRELDEMVDFQELEPVAERARSLQRFLSEDLPRHIQDEEADLFPALIHRCEGDVNATIILEQLIAEHELDRGLVEPILAELEAIVRDGAPLRPTRFFMDVGAFVETQRRHLLWENRVVLPLADEVLTNTDKLAVAKGFAERRSGHLGAGRTA